MLPSLPEERCALEIHRETRLPPVYALTAAKGGIGLPKAQDGDGGEFTCGELMPAADAPAVCSPKDGRLRCRSLPASCRILARTVIDKTGVAGKFHGNLAWACHEATVGTGTPSGPESPLRPSIIDAGLNLGENSRPPKAPWKS